MGQILHGCATTTHAIRAAIQRSKASVPQTAERYGLNQKTVRNWRSGKTMKGDALTICFNSHYLSDALASFESDSICLDARDPGSAAFLPDPWVRSRAIALVPMRLS